MSTSIAPVGLTPGALRAQAGPSGSGMVTQATQLTAPSATDRYQASNTAYPGYAYPSYPAYQPAPTQPSGLNVGRLASWAAGGFAAFKWVLPVLGRGNPAGLVVAGVIGGGAFAGNWVYNKLTGQGPAPQPSYPGQPTGSGLPLGKLAAIGGGAFAAFRFVLPNLRNPSGLVVAGVVGAGAFVGNWLYKAVTGK